VSNKNAQRLLIVGAICLLSATALRLVRVLPTGSNLTPTSGEWLALALDLTDGVFYRPLISDLGYGGTRYFPLHFVMHAGLIKLFGHPLITGHAISIASGLGLLAGVYVLLRRLGVRPALSASGATLVLAGYASQFAISTIRGDLLPTALNIWGLACCASPKNDKESRSLVIYATIFFVLAFAAKVTMVYGFAAAFAALMLSHRNRDAWTLLGLTSLGMAIVLAAMWVASNGRAFDCLVSCSSGGGTLNDLLLTPRRFIISFIASGPINWVFWSLGTAGLLFFWRRTWRELPSLALLTTGAVTVGLYASPGISFNHLLDMNVMMVVFLLLLPDRGRAKFSFAVTTLAVIAIVASFLVLVTMRLVDLRHSAERFDCVLNQVKDSGPIFTDNTLIPVLAGERPFALSSFMLGVIQKHDSAIAHDLNSKLEQGYFGSVVLDKSPFTPKDEELMYEWTYEWSYGEDFTDRILKRYELVASCGNFFVFRRRHDIDPMTSSAKRSTLGEDLND